MYQVYFTDEKGRLYTNYGFNQKIGDGDEFVLKEFFDLEKAKCYAKAFVRRYPQACGCVDKDGETVKYFENKAYWEWQKKHKTASKKTSWKMNKLAYLLAIIQIALISFSLNIIHSIFTFYKLSFLGSFIIIFTLIGSIIFLMSRGLFTKF